MEITSEISAPALHLSAEGDCDWKTIHGSKVCIGEGGLIKDGAKHLVGKTISKKGHIVDTEKSNRSKGSAKRVDKKIQRYSEEKGEPELAKGINDHADIHAKNEHSVSLRDNEAADVITHRDGKIVHGTELKTVVNNGNRKITMSGDAIDKKAAWMKQNHAPIHTVVHDDTTVYEANGEGQHGDISGRKMYYKRGYGSFRTGSMQPVADHAELHTLMNTPEHELPANARPTVRYVNDRKAARIPR